MVGGACDPGFPYCDCGSTSHFPSCTQLSEVWKTCYPSSTTVISFSAKYPVG